ncbi:DUF1266 domain-containing protein [Myroides pelagicus]|uniref:DUF1266 domain-containing protein n=1 Tax=Myroides pelagicus TaxID=270914 RepID=UPI002DBA9ADD|nr:DUF1266 domain-containing protein [Myroides pelagicus]MEC4114230.1 DUF1266 domain-containing protein [Myroides pelagicus]
MSECIALSSFLDNPKSISNGLLLYYFQDVLLDTPFGLDPNNEEHVYDVQRFMQMHKIKNSKSFRVFLHNLKKGDYFHVHVKDIVDEIYHLDEVAFTEHVEQQKGAYLRNRYRLLYPQRYAIVGYGILGFNYALYSLVCRIGGVLGYITEKEVHTRHCELFEYISRAFVNGRELQENIMLGIQFYEASLQACPTSFSRKGSYWNIVRELQNDQLNSNHS